MRTDLKTIVNLKNFFKLINCQSDHVIYNFKIPSRMLLQNIYKSWLQSLCSKSNKHFPVYVNNSIDKVKKKSVPFGLILPCSLYEHNEPIMHSFSQYAPETKTKLELNVYVPKQDVMQYFIQWQRYRKYWWSSITTTPSLFTINEIKHKNEFAIVDIVANFDGHQPIVETVSLIDNDETHVNSSCISCSTTLEGALFTLLLDGSNGNSKHYLGLHRKMAPYKISFALDYEDLEVKETLNELAFLIYNNLESNKISTWLPNFELPMELQIRENLLMGVLYTAVISKSTLSQGILHLLNSRTMLKEQVHIADVDTYASLLFTS